MITKPGKNIEKLISVLGLLLVFPHESQAAQQIHREFLGTSGIVSVTAEQDDEHHARVTAVQIAHDQYHEIRLLNPSTGEIEVLEYSNPQLQVTYSLPVNGQFQKLQIKRREKNGLRIADLVLASDGSYYIPVQNQFRKYQVFRQESNPSEAGDCRQTEQPVIKDKEGIDAALAPLRDTSENVVSQTLDLSCQKPPYSSEYSSIVAGLSLVVGTRDSKSSNSGKFLSCLNQHKLGLFSEELKKYFSDSLKMPKKPTVVCENTNSGARGEYFEETKMTYLRAPWAYAGNKEPEKDATAYYADTFFHESLHRAGIEDEHVVDKVVGCCGMEKESKRAKSCERLDERVAQTNDRNAMVAASLQTLEGFKDFWIKIQKETDEERTNAFFDDFFELLRKTRSQGGADYVQCMKSGKTAEACTQTSLKQIDINLETYFSKSCPDRFKDRKDEDAKKLCQSLETDSKEIVKKNLIKVCDPTKTNAYERSCLFVSRVEKEKLIAEAIEKGDLLDAPHVLSDDPSTAVEKRGRDAFLTAYMNQFPALKGFYAKYKDKINDERTEAMFTAMLKTIGQLTNNMSGEYADCVSYDEKNGPAACANHLKDEFFNGENGLKHFFKHVCPTYFTGQQAKKYKPCDNLHTDLATIFRESFAGGCKTEDPSKRIGIPGNDLTCLFNAISEGKYNLAHYDELQKAGKLMDSSGRFSALTAVQQARKTAGEVAVAPDHQPKSISMADQANKQAGHASKTAPTTSTTPSATAGGPRFAYGGPSYDSGSITAFDPSQGVDQLKNEYSRHSSAGATVLRDAARVMADMAVPRAKAATTRYESDTSSLAMKPPTSAIAGSRAVANAINIGSIDPMSMGPQGTRFAAKADGSAKTQARAQAQAQSGSERASGGRSPASAGATSASKQASRKSGSAKASSKSSSGASGSSGGGSGPGAAQGSTGSQGDLQSRQHQLLGLFKNDPKTALTRLKNGSLESELAADFIQAMDDEGKVHGSKNPQVSIRYDATSESFLGLPDL